MTSDSLCKDYDLSSISGSDDEDEKESGQSNDLQRRIVGDIKNKIFLKLHNGEILSLWKGLLLNESESILFENKKALAADDIRNRICLTENEFTKKLKYLIHEPRDNTRLRIVLLARGGHFAGCVFDGTKAVAHKTFHRLVFVARKYACFFYAINFVPKQLNQRILCTGYCNELYFCCVDQVFLLSCENMLITYYK